MSSSGSRLIDCVSCICINITRFSYQHAKEGPMNLKSVFIFPFIFSIFNSMFYVLIFIHIHIYAGKKFKTFKMWVFACKWSRVLAGPVYHMLAKLPPIHKNSLSIAQNVALTWYVLGLQCFSESLPHSWLFIPCLCVESCVLLKQVKRTDGCSSYRNS